MQVTVAHCTKTFCTKNFKNKIEKSCIFKNIHKKFRLNSICFIILVSQKNNIWRLKKLQKKSSKFRPKISIFHFESIFGFEIFCCPPYGPEWMLNFFHYQHHKLTINSLFISRIHAFIPINLTFMIRTLTVQPIEEQAEFGNLNVTIQFTAEHTAKV